MLIYALNHTPRLQYLLDELIVNRLGLNYKITDNLDYFHKSTAFKINYSLHIIEGCVNIPPISLLAEEHVFEQHLAVQTDQSWRYIFFKKEFDQIPDFRINSVFLSFDLFSAIFFLLSRYEEYLPSVNDEHHRYKAENSLAYKNGFLEIPLIDIWVEHFKEELKKLYPKIEFKQHEFKQINSIDIDFAYKYKGLSLFRLARKAMGSLLRGKFDINTLFIPEADPFDTYDYMTNRAREMGVKSIFFILLADYGGVDKSHSPNSKILKQLFKKLNAHFECGIHPSYYSTQKYITLNKEISLFEKITQKRPRISRNHFLKIKIPGTYEHLEKLDIERDYSLTYPNHIGFRASTSYAFKFFNLTTNQCTKLVIQAPCIMDVTLRLSLQLNQEEAIEKIKVMKEDVKEVNGTFISIWHNSSFDETEGWLGWDKVYEALFE